MHNIHPTAIVSADTVIATDVEIGPYAVIGYDCAPARARYYGHPPRQTPRAPTIIETGTFVGPHAIVGAGASIGENTIIEPGCYIGEESRLLSGGFIRYGARIYSYVNIGTDCVIAGFVCNHTTIGSRVAFFGSTVHRFAGIRVGQHEPAPTLEDDVIVGFGAVIIGGVTLPRGTIVKAGNIIK